jgi:intein-encoded DNA endonuclease-like protein
MGVPIKTGLSHSVGVVFQEDNIDSNKRNYLILDPEGIEGFLSVFNDKLIENKNFLN